MFLIWINADGTSHSTTVVFSDDLSCNFTTNYSTIEVYQCDITTLTANGSCNTTNNTYLTGQITFTSAPATGTMTVSVAGGRSQAFNAH
ncbi:MAG: hypothetical protein U0T36_10650 [Saprospiraceae bacterium]